jgi:hypothetical protein
MAAVGSRLPEGGITSAHLGRYVTKNRAKFTILYRQ